MILRLYFGFSVFAFGILPAACLAQAAVGPGATQAATNPLAAFAEAIEKATKDALSLNAIVGQASQGAANQTSALIGAPASGYGQPVAADPFFEGLLQQARSPQITQTYRQKFQTPVSPLGGLGLIPWGSGFTDVVLGGDIEPGSISYIENFKTRYETLEQSGKSQAQQMAERKALHSQQDGLIAMLNLTYEPAQMSALPDLGAVTGRNQDGEITYLFADDALYAVNVSPKPVTLSENASIVQGQRDTIEVYSRALTAKYGTPEVTKKTINIPVVGAIDCITQTWKNPQGTAVMTLLPINKLTADAGRMALELAEIYMKSTIDSTGAGGTMVGEGAKRIVDFASQATEEWFKEFEKQYQLSSITYFSNQAIADGSRYKSRFEERKAKDSAIESENRERGASQKAAELLDRL